MNPFIREFLELNAISRNELQERRYMTLAARIVGNGTLEDRALTIARYEQRLYTALKATIEIEKRIIELKGKL